MSVQGNMYPPIQHFLNVRINATGVHNKCENQTKQMAWNVRSFFSFSSEFLLLQNQHFLETESAPRENGQIFPNFLMERVSVHKQFPQIFFRRFVQELPQTDHFFAEDFLLSQLGEVCLLYKLYFNECDTLIQTIISF